MQLRSILSLLAATPIAFASAQDEVNCDIQRKCSSESIPVCGSDGVTYTNQCQFENAVCQARPKTLTKQSDGPCENPYCGIRCATQYAPVCGSDGQTYSNDCMLLAGKCSNPKLEQAYVGECTQGYPPTGTTSKPPVCKTACPKNYSPVCGTNGITYGNQCLLDAAACRNPSKGIKTARPGRCPRKPKPTPKPKPSDCAMPVCAAIYAPLCGSDGKTYGNPCTFNYAQCLDPKLTKVSDGECGGSEPAAACAALSCAEFTECKVDEATGNGYCADTCAAGRCKAGETCELQQVNCITTPCPPIAVCK